MRRLPDAPRMAPPPTPLHRQEVLRLRKLESVGLLDTGTEPAFDALVRSAAQLAGASAARLHLVTAGHLWPKAVHGTAAVTLARAGSPCAEVVAADTALLHPDAWVDAGDRAPWRAYAGVPVHVDELPVGTLSIVDTQARPDWQADLLTRLQDLALLASALLQGRKGQRKAELRQQAEQAHQDKLVAELASRSKTAFMSRMSHEMRTPLNAIIGFAQLLRLRAGARLDHVEHILNAGQHLLTLVNDVLDLQRVEADELDLQLRTVALLPLIEDCLAMLGPLADARAVHQRFDATDVALHALADAQRLRQVLLNIGSNAIKYNQPAGRVHWSVRKGAAGRVVVTVSDSGTGMTTDELARLFQPFERLGRETSNVEGSGLGLVISRRLVDAMGGRLQIASEPGVGTQVSIELPAARAEPQPAVVATPSRPLPLTPQALRLLYVEDNRINALLFQEALRHHAGFELRVAEDGREALEIVGEWQPDVLVLDAHLPGDSGHEVLRRLRELPALRAAPAYMCSADAMPEDVQRALATGFCGYWTKPLDIDAVLDELHALRTRIGTTA